MKKIVSLAALFLSLLALRASALTLEPLQGVSGQSAPQSTFFALPPAVKAIDPAGQPVAGLTVTFSAIPYDGSNGFIFFPGSSFGFENEWTAKTGADGIATTAPGAIGYIAGASGVVASATIDGPLGPATASVTIPLTVTPGGVTSFRVVSGNHQRAPVGTAYASAWVVEALDAAGRPVPYAATFFYATEDATQPSLLFGGDHDIWVRADASGIATSPVPVANLVEGKQEGYAATLNYHVNVSDAFFDYTNTRPASDGGGGDGCGRQGKGNGDCGNSPAHSGGNGNNGKGKG